jgi:purine-binding chemotaxis protein CheW
VNPNAPGTSVDLEELDELSRNILHRRAEALSQQLEEETVEELVGILTFSIDDEWYAVRIEHVREIYNEYDVTAIPTVPPHILGVINIRGEIISVTDLATLLQLRRDEESESPAIVVGGEESVTALLVDAIGDIVDVASDDIEPPLSGIGKAQVEYVEGSVSIGERLVALVNLDAVLEPIGLAD